MIDQIYKQKTLPLKDLQPEQYLRLPGKFYTCKSANKVFNFQDYKVPKQRQESTFITLQQTNQDQSNLNESLHSRIKSDVSALKIKSTKDVESSVNLPKILQQQSKQNISKTENSTSQFLKRVNLPSLVGSITDLQKSDMKNEYKSLKSEINRTKLHSFDVKITSRAYQNENGDVDKKTTNNEENINNSINICPNSNKVNKNLYSNQSSLMINSGIETPRNLLDMTEILKNPQSQQQIKQLRIQTENSSINFLDQITDTKQTSRCINSKNQYEEILPADLIHSLNREKQIFKEMTQQEEHNLNKTKKIENQVKQQQEHYFTKKNYIRKSSKSVKTESDYNIYGLNNYLSYLRQNNSSTKAQSNLEQANSLQRIEKNVEQHMAKLDKIINDDVDDKTGKQKLKKIALSVIKASRFSNQLDMITNLKKNKNLAQKQQFISDLDNFKNGLSVNHSVFIKEFYYTVQEFIQLISSLKRASQLIQQISGFNHVIKQILFVDDEIRKDLSVEVMEKQVVSVMQFYQLKKDQSPEISPTKLKNKRKGMWFGLSQESVRELQFFYKNLRACVDQRNFDNKLIIQSKFNSDFDQIQKILQKYILSTNYDKTKIKDQCFKDLKVGHDDEKPWFIQNNKPLEDLRYWEKHLGKFEIVSEYVREKDQQISNMCKIYQNL